MSSPDLDDVTLAKVAEAGELLIRAAAVLGTLSQEQQLALARASDGNLPDTLAFCLRAARNISPAVRDSLNRHPPVGFIGIPF